MKLPRLSLKQRFLVLSLVFVGLLAALVMAAHAQMKDLRMTRHRLEEDWGEIHRAFAVQAQLSEIHSMFENSQAETPASEVAEGLATVRREAARLRKSILRDLAGIEAESEEMRGLMALDSNLDEWDRLIQQAAAGELSQEAALLQANLLFEQGSSAITAFSTGALGELDVSLEYLDDREDEFHRFVSYAVAGFVLLLLLAWTGLALWILRPIAHLQSLVRKIRRREFHVEVIPHGPDEVGELLESFAEMAASLGMFTENLESLVRQRTEELETSRAQLRRMLDGLPEAVALVERPGGRILFANAPWRALLGEGDHSPVPALLQTPAGPEGCHAFDPPGEESSRQLAIITRELSPPEGSGSIVLEHVRDMTQQLRTNAALASSQRLASIGRLSSGIAHEINNPLTAIAACAEGLLKRIGTPRFEQDIVKEYLTTIHDEVFRCKEITGKLLESSRPHEPGMATCVPCELIHSAVQLTSPLAERSGVRIRIADCADADLISDGPTIRQILLNLLLNAVEASADGGEVVASCETRDSWCLLRVADDGRGIAPEDLQRLFEPFFSRRPDGSGTGLGLFVSQGLALALGGGIEAESQGPGCGALFTLRLPLNQTIPASSPAANKEFHHV